MKNCSGKDESLRMVYPLSQLPGMPALRGRGPYVATPTEAFCKLLWDKYEMLDNIRQHSLLVAHVAATLAQWSVKEGLELDVGAVRASGLLHDLAKTWSVRHGGSHAMLGASWAVQETRHYGIAQGVLLHVHWPWALPEGRDICCLPIFVLYADKRVRHDQCVTLDERFEDLLERYGRTQRAINGISQSFKQAKNIEAELSRQLQRDLHEDTFDCGRLVH